MKKLILITFSLFFTVLFFVVNADNTSSVCLIKGDDSGASVQAYLVDLDTETGEVTIGFNNDSDKKVNLTLTITCNYGGGRTQTRTFYPQIQCCGSFQETFLVPTRSGSYDIQKVVTVNVSGARCQ